MLTWQCGLHEPGVETTVELAGVLGMTRGGDDGSNDSESLESVSGGVCTGGTGRGCSGWGNV